MGFFKTFDEKVKKVQSKLVHHPPKPKPKPMIGGAGGVRQMPVFKPGLVHKMPSMREGGAVVKTGPHYLHKGEMVLPAEHVTLFKKLMKK